MEQTSYDFAQALGVMRRRKRQFWIAFGILALLTVIITFSWPAMYRATGTILITQEEIPSELVPSTIGGYAEQQIRGIEQRVMTSKNMLDIIDKFGLFKDEQGTVPRTELVDMARERVLLEMISAEVVDPRNGRPQQATIAFTLSFDYENPKTAQQVANELVSLFLNENLRLRMTVTRDTAEFLAQQAADLNRQILDLEAQLARFKQENQGALPHDYATNLQARQRTEIDLAETERTLLTLRDRQVELESELARVSRDVPMRTDAGTVLPPLEQLSMLRSQYASLLALYGEAHPDVVRVKRQIAGLEQSTGATSDGTDVEGQLEAARSELASARERYTEDHPEVQRLERTVAGLEEQLASAGSEPAAAPSPLSATNPQYLQLQLRLRATLADIQSLQAKREGLHRNLVAYDNALQRAPEAERMYTALTRQLDDVRAQYHAINAKQMEAELSRQVEQNRKGERFELVEPPVEPTEPYSPNRLAWLFLGLVLTIAGSVGSVAVAESLDTAVRGSESITTLLGAAPLAVIPYILTEGESTGVDKRKVLLGAGIAAGAVVVVLTLLHFLYKPLDVVWYIVMRKLGM
jgi:polysaccharide biosynthesis transport protein